MCLYSTVPSCDTLHVLARLFYLRTKVVVLSYESTKVRKVRKYESTKVQLRKYLRTKVRKYESTKVLESTFESMMLSYKQATFVPS
jgi:hypothetical protein